MPLAAGLQFHADWLIMGVVQQNSEQVMLIASNELYNGELHQDTEMEEVLENGLPPNAWRQFRQGRSTITLNTNMQSYTVAMGANFSEAMNNLLQEWSPDRALPRSSL